MQLKLTLTEFAQMNQLARKSYMMEHGDLLLTEMLSHIGDNDAELRDQLIYRIFIEMLSDEDLLTNEQIIALFEQAISNDYLYAGIGEVGTDTVFTRSFSALLVAGILALDNTKHILPEKLVIQYFDKWTHLLMKERDTRGFVDSKGWAHSIAHGADLAVATINHYMFELRMAPMILQAVKSCLWKDTVYVDDEEERLVGVLEALITFGMPEEVLMEWVEQVFDKLDMHLYQNGYNAAFFKARTCTLNVMKTFYFILKTKNIMPKLEGVVYLQIGKWLKLG